MVLLVFIRNYRPTRSHCNYRHPLRERHLSSLCKTGLFKTRIISHINPLNFVSIRIPISVHKRLKHLSFHGNSHWNPIPMGIPIPVHTVAMNLSKVECEWSIFVDVFSRTWISIPGLSLSGGSAPHLSALVNTVLPDVVLRRTRQSGKEIYSSIPYEQWNALCKKQLVILNLVQLETARWLEALL